MQKALQQMNLQLHHVLTDITGVTGQQILRAIVAGERDPKVLASFRQPGCKADEATILKALTGSWREEHLFVLGQSLAMYDAYTEQLVACNTEIERQFTAVKPRWDAPDELPPLPPVKPGSKTKNQPAESTRQELFRIVGVDLVAVAGISTSLAQTLLTEIGTDMSKWPDVKHYASWLGLAPHNDISGGKVLRSRTLKTDNRAGQASPGRRLGHPLQLSFWSLLSPQTRSTGSRPSPGRHGSQDRPHRLFYAQVQSAL
jgi:hypothetical protein